MSYFPDMPKYHVGPDRYLELLHKGKKSVTIPVIASLNGRSPGGWVRYAEFMEQAGADALELNIFDIPSDPSLPPTIWRRATATWCAPSVRASAFPSRSNWAHTSLRVRISSSACRKPAPTASSSSTASISQTSTSRSWKSPRTWCSAARTNCACGLHWAAILYHQVETYIAITGGVHDSSDVLKCMMAGAHVAMMTSALLKYGIEHIGVVLAGMESWMEEHEYVSVRQMRGSMSMVNVENPAAFLRGNYMKMLGSYYLARAWHGPKQRSRLAISCRHKNRKAFAVERATLYPAQ